MKTCKKCNVLIKDDTDICPLCKYLLHDNNISGSEQIYPKITTTINKYNLATKILFIISIITTIACIAIDLVCNSTYHFSIIYIVSVLYCWFTTLYSIKKNKNIASQVLIQAIFLQILVVIIDLVTGFEKWSLNFAIPIIIVASNIIMFILSIIENKDFSKYVIYQIVITICSLVPILLYLFKLTPLLLPSLISLIIAVITFLCIFIFCNNDFREEFKRRFHF